jgi:hypothetical protein
MKLLKEIMKLKKEKIIKKIRKCKKDRVCYITDPIFF